MKQLLSVIVSIIILLIIIGFVIYLFRAPLAEKVLSSKLGTTVSLKQIDFKSDPSRIVVDQFKVKNPPDYKYPYALEIQTSTIEAPYSNYLKSIVVIDKVELENVSLTVEIPAVKLTNWDTLLGFMGKPGATENTAATAKENYAVIKLLVFKNFTVRVVQSDGKVTEKTFDRLEYRDIKTNEGDTGRKIMQAIIYQMLFNAKDFFNIPLDITKDNLQKVITPKGEVPGTFEKLNPFKKD